MKTMKFGVTGQGERCFADCFCRASQENPFLVGLGPICLNSGGFFLPRGTDQLAGGPNSPPMRLEKPAPTLPWGLVTQFFPVY